MKKILILGGCGYVGSKLIPHLLEKKYLIYNIDIEWFGKNLKNHKNLKHHKGDIRNFNFKKIPKVDSIIHLANIANDPSVELNQSLSWEVNVLSTIKIMNYCLSKKIKHLVYASSGSVYGFKKEKKVTENLDLVPISIYNKTKMVNERLLSSYSKKIKIHIIRPATVCGLSNRLRLDLSVNLLTYSGLKNKLQIFGGDQIRPNIHIDDLVNLYEHFLINKQKIKPGIYNAGFENLSIKQIALKIQKKLGCKILKKKIFDVRSYRLDSSKLIKTNFYPKKKVNDAINEIIENFKTIKKKHSVNNYNIKKMKKLNIF